MVVDGILGNGGGEQEKRVGRQTTPQYPQSSFRRQTHLALVGKDRSFFGCPLQQLVM